MPGERGPSLPWCSQPGTSGPLRCGPVSQEPTGHLPKGRKSQEAYNTEPSEWCRTGTQGWLPNLVGHQGHPKPLDSPPYCLSPRGAQSHKEKAVDRLPVTLQGRLVKPGPGSGSRTAACRASAAKGSRPFPLSTEPCTHVAMAGAYLHPARAEAGQGCARGRQATPGRGTRVRLWPWPHHEPSIRR